MIDHLTLDQAADSVFSVSDLNNHISHVLAADPILCDIAVAGEISNFKAHSSGHLYFSLRDETAQIRCCLWKRGVSRLSFRPSDGDRVIATGNVELYAARGEISFIVRDLHFAGQGALFEAFERLKNLLAGEGLFDEARKKQLPAMPRRIGLITSPTGAVAHDVLTVLARRYPLATVVFIPAAVQGFSAAADLTRALHWAEALGDLDVVIMARGGGSSEDLWCFNEEALIRRAAAFPFPLISAIGHETDFTLLDFVADRRAPTPSAAAEIVAPDVRDLLALVRGARQRLHRAASGDMRLARQKLDYFQHSRVLNRPGEHLGDLRTRVAVLRARVQDAAKGRVKIDRQSLEANRAQLRALDPRRVLERGYAVLADAGTGALVTALSQVRSGQKLVVTLQDGNFTVISE